MREDIISNHFAALHERIRRAAENSQRDANSISLLAVSKSKPVELIQQAYACGQRRFGENYPQEALEKIAGCKQLHGIEWHFLGRIQSNKCKTLARHFDWVQSVDRLPIAQALSRHRAPKQAVLNVLLQINPDGQVSKGGVAPEDAASLAHQLSALPGIQLRGLMTIPQPQARLERMRTSFLVVKQVYEQLQQSGFALDTLSMGMSQDFEIAIEAGATMIRVGTALFGQR
jgi:pyridoxal phosphate enzyme (YggS family)